MHFFVALESSMMMHVSTELWPLDGEDMLREDVDPPRQPE